MAFEPAYGRSSNTIPRVSPPAREAWVVAPASVSLIMFIIALFDIRFPFSLGFCVSCNNSLMVLSAGSIGSDPGGAFGSLP